MESYKLTIEYMNNEIYKLNTDFEFRMQHEYDDNDNGNGEEVDNEEGEYYDEYDEDVGQHKETNAQPAIDANQQFNDEYDDTNNPEEGKAGRGGGLDAMDQEVMDDTNREETKKCALHSNSVYSPSDSMSIDALKQGHHVQQSHEHQESPILTKPKMTDSNSNISNNSKYIGSHVVAHGTYNHKNTVQHANETSVLDDEKEVKTRSGSSNINIVDNPLSETPALSNGGSSLPSTSRRKSLDTRMAVSRAKRLQQSVDGLNLNEENVLVANGSGNGNIEKSISMLDKEEDEDGEEMHVCDDLSNSVTSATASANIVPQPPKEGMKSRNTKNFTRVNMSRKNTMMQSIGSDKKKDNENTASKYQTLTTIENPNNKDGLGVKESTNIPSSRGTVMSMVAKNANRLTASIPYSRSPITSQKQLSNPPQHPFPYPSVGAGAMQVMAVHNENMFMEHTKRLKDIEEAMGDLIQKTDSRVPHIHSLTDIVNALSAENTSYHTSHNHLQNAVKTLENSIFTLITQLVNVIDNCAKKIDSYASTNDKVQDLETRLNNIQNDQVCVVLSYELCVTCII